MLLQVPLQEGQICLQKGRGRFVYKRGKGYDTTEAEIGVLWPQAKECRHS